ncbi:MULTISPECIES: YqaJ viral recombinase family nuclease [Streptomyces]|uniref:YqaJ viral recombinase family nuclease n=1 Tax=Streptomyces TaxID=1883 RepID=UPI002ED54698|nr:YqaJ viral recombinase family protein [Streptomyces sp. NBC_00826]WTH94204.1 YqaJ viral recombinase family protein [Streptomyces sp. NBC_00825]WTI02939.1 YqaJ viral recombinase family protein [Streptomyces sp. NBC_00822]
MPEQATHPWTPTAAAGDLAHGAPAARLLLPAGDLDDPEYYQLWTETRRGGIGGSDVAALLGLDKYRGPRHVFEVKHGRPVPTGAALSEYAEVGQEIEDFIAYMFTKRSGIPAVPTPGTLANVDRPWMRCNVDRYALDPVTGAVIAPVELKNRSEYQLDDWTDGVPDGPALQVHWNIAVGGWSYGWAVALVGGNKLRFHRIERDEELIETLIDVCGRWFQRHVVEGFAPPADGLEATKELLGRLWEVNPKEAVEVPLSKAKKLRKRRASLIEQIEELDQQRTLVENEMRLISETSEVAKCGKSTAWSWKQNGNFAAKRFTDENPELAAQYATTVPALDVERLKADHPKTYEKYRARVLRVPAKEL